MDNVIRTVAEPVAEAPKAVTPDWKPNERGPEAQALVEEPLDNTQDAILSSLGIGDVAKTLPTEELNNLTEIEGYLREVLDIKGVVPTKSTVDKALSGLKTEMGLDESSDPRIVLDRMGGVIKAWKQLSFITNPQEKKSLFLKLANTNSSKEMNRIVYQEMEAKKIWQ